MTRRHAGIACAVKQCGGRCGAGIGAAATGGAPMPAAGSEAQAGEQVVHLPLVLDHVGLAFRRDLRAVQQRLGAAGRADLLGRERGRGGRELLAPLGRVSKPK